MSDLQRLYGLVVDSELDLHQERPAPAGAEADVVVRWGPQVSPAEVPPAGRHVVSHVTERRWYDISERADGGWHLRFHRACDVQIDATLRDVVVHPVSGSDRGFSQVLTSGATLAFQLYARGLAVLHASAVQVGGEAVAFVGSPGMGKSTMAAVLCAEGGALITDDVLRLDVDGDHVLTSLGATELRLRKGADVLVDRFSADAPDRRTSADARQVLRLGDVAVDGSPLRAVVVPLPDRSGAPLRVERLAGTAALMELVRYPRIMGWQDPAVHAHQLKLLGEVVRRVPVFRAAVPWGPPFATDLGAQLLDALRAEVGADAFAEPVAAAGR